MTLPNQLSPDFDRATGIGASEVGAVLGLSRWMSPYALWALKTGRVEPDPPNPAMEWGLRLQDAVLSAYADRGNPIRRNSRTKRSPLIGGILFATPDAFRLDGRARSWAVDAKVARSPEGWGEDGSSVVPPDYYAQAQVQALVYDLAGCDLAVLIGGSDFRVFPIPANRADQRLITEALRDWWNTYVMGDTPPPITEPLDSTDRALGSMFSGGEGVMPPTVEAEALTADLAMAWHNRKAVNAAYDLARQQVEALMGNYERLETDHAKVSWARSKDSTVVAWDLVAKAYRQVIQAMKDATGFDPNDPQVDLAQRLELPELSTVGGLEVLLDTLESLHTVTKPGTRRFLVTPTNSTED